MAPSTREEGVFRSSWAYRYRLTVVGPKLQLSIGPCQGNWRECDDCAHESTRGSCDCRLIGTNCWWLFPGPGPPLRESIAGLNRFIVTSETSKHRIFRLLDAQGTIVDGSVIVIAASDAFIPGILSSHIHRSCAERAGRRQGAGSVKPKPPISRLGPTGATF